MNMTMQVVPEGVIGIVGLEIVAGGMSRNADKIIALTNTFAAEVDSLRESIKLLDACGAIDLKTALALHQRQQVIGRAVYDHLVHQLTTEAI